MASQGPQEADDNSRVFFHVGKRRTSDASRQAGAAGEFIAQGQTLEAVSGQEALRLWMVKSFLQFGFEKNPQESNKAVELLLQPKILDSWGTYATGPRQTLTVSTPGEGKEVLVEFTRDNGRWKKPTVIRGHYDGKSQYDVTLQFPQLTHAVTMTQSKKVKSSPEVITLLDKKFAGWLASREQLQDMDFLARRQLSEPGFKAWEHIRDKYGNYMGYSPRVALLGEIAWAELFHILDWNGFKKEHKPQGRLRLDIVYGHLGDKELGEPKPIDKEQAEELFRKLLERGYTPDKKGDILTKTISYKGKPVEIEIRITQPAISNKLLTRGMRHILAQTRMPAVERRGILKEILEKGEAAPAGLFAAGALARAACDRINALIEKFKREQMSRSFKAKRAFEDSLAEADVVVYDGHAGNGAGFGFSAAGPSHDDVLSFRIGKIKPYIYKEIEEITKNEFLRKLLRMSKYSNEGYFDYELPFTLPFSRGKDLMERLVIDPKRQRQLLFFDACNSLTLYDKLWSQLLRHYQKIVSPGKFDMLGTLNDADPADGVAAKLGMVKAVEHAMNAGQTLELIRAGAKHGTQYGPGRHMGVDGEGTYKEIYPDSANKSHSVNLSNSETAGFVIDNNGARMSFSEPSNRVKSYPLQ